MKYGYEMISWEDAIDLGLMYAVRTLDPLTGEINEGSSTLTYCATNQQAELIVRAVNAESSHGPLLKAAKRMHLLQIEKAPELHAEDVCETCKVIGRAAVRS